MIDKAREPLRPLNSEPLEQDIASYIAGDDPAGARICRGLEPAIRTEVRRFFRASDTDYDDIVQDTLLHLLAYLRRTGRGPDRPIAFAVTMAGNRCRNLYRWRQRRPTVELDQATAWITDEGDDPLERLAASEQEGLIRTALSRMPAACRELLLAIYSDERPMEELQREAGLGTVQGIHYRKYACLKKLGQLLNESLFGGQENGKR